jgi:hypothetical protein
MFCTIGRFFLKILQFAVNLLLNNWIHLRYYKFLGQLLYIAALKK